MANSSNDTVDKDRVVLVYRIYLESEDLNNDEIGYINAHSGKIEMTEPRLIHGTGTFATRYSGNRQAETNPISGGHRLFDDTRGADIHTRNLQNNSMTLSSAIELVDNDNNWTNAEHGINNNDMGLDVHWGLQEIYDRLNSVHGFNSFDDSGVSINAYVRYGTNVDNAFWDPTLNVLLFGQGNSLFSPLVSIDVVAHEFGHGITDFQIGWGTSERAFNEGMSDIWGVILEQRIRPSSTWQIGEQITLTAPYLRNIQNTNDSSALSQIADTFQSTQYNNTTDFYVRSGVLSHWFYILTNGESGTNDINDSYAVDGIGLDLAEELIVEAVFNNYLDGTTTYPAIRTAFINAAEAIFCENSLEVKAVIDAWYAVGVGTKSQGVGVITGADTICASGTYSIPTSGATFYNWSVIAGSNIASITSGSSSVTLTQTGTNFGSVTIQATYGNSSCGSTTLTKEVYVGKPTVNIYRTYEWCEGKYHYITFEAYTNPANIQVNWSYFPPPGSNFYENGNTLQVELPKNYQSNFFEIYATVTNPCGTTGVFYEDIVKKCGTFVNQPPFSAMVSPNPANSELNVFTTFTEEAEKETGNEVKELNYEIYDVYGALLYSNKHREASVKINTDNFKEGYYILILTYKEERVTKNFIIKH